MYRRAGRAMHRVTVSSRRMSAAHTAGGGAPSTTVPRVRAPAAMRPASILRHLPVERGCAVVRDGGTTVVAADPAVVRTASGEAGFDVLREVDASGFWVGFCSYEFGRTIEHVRPRAAASRARSERAPDVAFARYEARILLADDGSVDIVGEGRARSRLEAAVRAAERSGEAASSRFPVGPARAGCWASSMDRVDHAAACAHVFELLDAGECYQVNITRRLTSPGPADPIALYDALERANPAPHAALCTFGGAHPDIARDFAIVSASPELFLRIERNPGGRRSIETRPIKGTAADARRLATSAKDHAENVMIVDLARNDLGRVCEFGSVQVPGLCEIESHPGLFHLVSTITGELPAAVGLADVVRATFPPASVTGAPKPRVMQAIEDLEPVDRGVYCGAMGWVDADRDRAELAVAIRTFTVEGGLAHLGVGGGIVADSRADEEWAETELKAARLLRAIGSARDVDPAIPVGAP